MPLSAYKWIGMRNGFISQFARGDIPCPNTTKKFISRLYRFVKNKIKLELPKSSVVNLSFDGLTEGHKHFIGPYATYYIEELI
jgi:hypothetical protein